MRKTAAPGAGKELTTITLHLLLLSLVALAVYSNTFHSPFVFDDISSIVENQVIKDLPRFLSGAGYDYNPRRFIGYLSFAVNYRLGGLDSVGYHLVNLAVHIVSGGLVYSLGRLTLRTPFFRGVGSSDRVTLVPLLAALLFVAHPVQTQAVTYIVQRLASLTAMFYLLALVCYVQGRLAACDEPAISGAGISIRVLRPAMLYLASLVFALLALRTKEIAATLPLVVLLYEFSFFGPGVRKKFLLLVPLLLLILIIPAGMIHAGKSLGELLSDVGEMSRESFAISRADYLLTQFSVIVTYLRLLILPVNQNLDYDYPVLHSFFTPRVFFSFLLLLALLGTAGWLYYRSARSSRRPSAADGSALIDPHCSRLVAFGILWFFITLAVESSLIPIRDVIFEHRLYLPSVGAFLAIAAAAAMLLRNCSLRTFLSGAATVVLVLGCASWQRNLVWKSPPDLWGDVVGKSPGKSRANNHYGVALSEVGRRDEAVDFLKAAIRIDPGNEYALYNLGRVYDQSGEIGEAIIRYQHAVDLNPDLVQARNNLAVDYLILGQADQAIEQYGILLKAKPDFAEAHNNLGFILKNKGRVDEAIVHYKSALAINNNYAKAYNNLGLAFQEKGLLDLAISQFREAVRLRPDDQVFREDLANSLIDRGPGRGMNPGERQ